MERLKAQKTRVQVACDETTGTLRELLNYETRWFVLYANTASVSINAAEPDLAVAMRVSVSGKSLAK
jgi:hypothetical protein